MNFLKKNTYLIITLLAAIITLLISGCVREDYTTKTTKTGLDMALVRRLASDPDLAKFAIATDSNYQYIYNDTRSGDTSLQQSLALYRLALQYAYKLQQRYQLTNTLGYIKAAALQYFADNGNPNAAIAATLKSKKQQTPIRSATGNIASVIIDRITGNIISETPGEGIYAYNNETGQLEPLEDPIYKDLAEVFVYASNKCHTTVKMKLYYLAQLYPVGMAGYLAGNISTMYYNCGKVNLEMLKYSPYELDQLYYAMTGYISYTPDDCDPSWLWDLESDLRIYEMFTTRNYQNYAPSGYYPGGGNGGGSGGSNDMLPESESCEPMSEQMMVEDLNFVNEINKPKYPKQAVPKWAKVLEGYPKIKYNDGSYGELSANEVYALIGGEIGAMAKNDPTKFENACAARLSMALLNAGVNIPNVKGYTYEGSNGKYYFLSAEKIFDFITQTFEGHYTTFKGNDASVSPSTFQTFVDCSPGLYIIKPSYPAKFHATGHATLFTGYGCIGGNNGCHFSAKGGVDKIIFVKLP